MTSHSLDHLNDRLQDVWTEFCKDRQMHGSCFALKNGVFSLILDALGENSIEICKACGFTEPQFNQLRLLLVKVEQQYLLTLFIAFENFKSRSMSQSDRMSSNAEELALATVKQRPISSTDSNTLVDKALHPNAEEDETALGNLKKKPSSRKRSIPNASHKECRVSLRKLDYSVAINERVQVKHENLAADHLELGRGKRKKFIKRQFDMLDAAQSRKTTLISKKQASSKESAAEKDKLEIPVYKTDGPLAVGDDLIAETQKLEESSNLQKNFLHDKDPENPAFEEENSSEKTRNNNFSFTKHGCEDISEEECKSLAVTGGSGSDSARIRSKYKTQEAGERTDFECDNLAPIICSICKEKLPNSRDLFKHWKQVHKENHDAPLNMFYCDVCNETFNAPRKFKLHYRIHSGARPHSCHLCDKKFRIYKGLMDHMLCHTKEKPFACLQCPKRFVNKKLLNHHIKVHNNEVVPRVCELCGKQYQTSLGLKLHYRVHAGLRPHKCDVCGMAFTQRCSLQIHKRLHTGDKRHICDVCGWRFNTNNALVTHRRVHTGERPYKCSQCPFQAASSSCLKDHQIVHSTAKPFLCRAPGCNKYFKRQAHLMTHLKKKHSGLKPYICHLCNAAFAMVSELLHHQKSDACDGGRIKREAFLQLETKPDFAESLSEPLNNIEGTDHQNKTVMMFENSEEVGDKDTPSVFGKSKPKFIQTSAQEFQVSHLTEVPDNEENQIVIHIVTEPGAEGTEVVLSEEEMAAIVRLSQQM